MSTAYDIIIRPIVTERSTSALQDKKYVFEVAPDAGKIQIKQAIEEIFGVKVADVNTLNVRGKKPWRQKGTGHARQGSTRAPQWTHGGVAFAPKPRDYKFHVNKKVRRLALKSVLSAKVQDGALVVVDDIKLDEIKTAAFRKFLQAVNAEGKAVIVTPEVNMTVYKSARNLPGVLTTPAAQLSVYDILNAKYLVLDKAALAKIEEVYA